MARGWCLAILVSGAAFAGERVRVAVHPIVAPGIDDAKLIVDLNREVQNILAETQHVTIVGNEDVERRLAEEGGRCAPRGKERIECLERMALATRADYSIAVVVKRLGREYELSGTLACSDRVVLEQPDPLLASDSGAVKVDAMLKHQLRVLLLERLKVGALPSDPRTRNPPPASTGNPTVPVAAESHPPVEAAKPVEMVTPTLRIASYASGGFAVLSGAAAIGLALSAKGDASSLQKDANGALASESDLGRLKDSRNKASMAAALGSVAGVAAVAAVMMFIMSPAEEPKMVVAPMVSGNGAGVGFSWRLP